MIGPLVGADDVCDAVQATLARWLPSVVREVQDLKQIAPPLEVPVPSEMPTAEALRTNGAVPFPALVVSSPGLDGRPSRRGDGTYDATWVIVVTVFTLGGSYDDTARRARNYATCVRTVLAQHQDLDGFADGVEWRDEDYAPIDGPDVQTLGGSFVTFAIRVDGVLNDRLGPVDPPLALTPPLPPVTSRILTTDRL